MSNESSYYNIYLHRNKQGRIHGRTVADGLAGHTAKVRLESEVVSFIFVYMRMRKRMRETKTKNEEDAAGIGGGGI